MTYRAATPARCDEAARILATGPHDIPQVAALLGLAEVTTWETLRSLVNDGRAIIIGKRPGGKRVYAVPGTPMMVKPPTLQSVQRAARESRPPPPKKMALRLDAEEREMMAHVRAGHATAAALAELMGMDARQVRRVGARLLDQARLRRDWTTAGPGGSRVMRYALPDAPKPPAPKPKAKPKRTYTPTPPPATPTQAILRRLHASPGLTARELGLDPADVAPLLARGVVEHFGAGLRVTRDGALCL